MGVARAGGGGPGGRVRARRGAAQRRPAALPRGQVRRGARPDRGVPRRVAAGARRRRVPDRGRADGPRQRVLRRGRLRARDRHVRAVDRGAREERRPRQPAARREPEQRRRRGVAPRAGRPRARRRAARRSTVWTAGSAPMHPKVALALYTLGEVWRRQGDPERALAVVPASRSTSTRRRSARTARRRPTRSRASPTRCARSAT